MADVCPVCGGVVTDELPSGYWCRKPCNRLWSFAEMALSRAARARERAAAFKAGLEAAAKVCDEGAKAWAQFTPGRVCADAARQIRALPVEANDEA